MRRWLPAILTLLVVGCGPRTVAVDLEPMPATPTTVSAPVSTTPPSVDVVWEAVAFDLHGVVRLEDSVRPGVATAPAIFDDGALVGEGRRTEWTADGLPEPVAQILEADCDRIGALLNRWADTL